MHKAKIKLLAPGRGIAFVEEGEGEALVFVHGSLCDCRYWLPQLSGLSDAYRVVVPSLSHFYPRLPSSVGRPFRWSAHVDQLAEFLPKVQGGRVHLVGHSRGACVAWQLALRHPELLASLTLIDPGGALPDETSDGSMPPDVLALRMQAVTFIEQGQVDDGLRLFVDSVSRPGFWDRSNAFFQNMARDNADTLAPQLGDPLPAYRQRDVASVKCPVMIFDGERSPPQYRLNAQRLGEWMPQARRVTIDGASHGMTITHAQRFNRELREFLRACG